MIATVRDALADDVAGRTVVAIAATRAARRGLGDLASGW
jgi:hypothetical protein